MDPLPPDCRTPGWQSEPWFSLGFPYIFLLPVGVDLSPGTLCRQIAGHHAGSQKPWFSLGFPYIFLLPVGVDLSPGTLCRQIAGHHAGSQKPCFFLCPRWLWSSGPGASIQKKIHCSATDSSANFHCSAENSSEVKLEIRLGTSLG